MKKGIVSIFFVILATTVLLVNAFNQYGSAGGYDNASAAESVRFIGYDENEIYDGSETDLLSWEKAVEAARAHMVQRDTSFSLYVEPTENGAEMIKDSATAHTGVPNEGDYLNRNLRYLTPTVYRRTGDDGTSYDLYSFTADYYTTKEQEDYITSQINEVLAQQGVYTMNNDLDKITTIYQWITEHVAYDYEHLDDSSYKLQYTAYAALHDGTAVCQGCATLLYRMILSAGIDCRCVRSESHAWNIIALDDVYYNADVTWDLGDDPKNFSYFLKGSVSFGENHTRLAEYDTDLFRSTYFVPDQDYILTTVETVKTEDDTIIDDMITDDMITDEPITQDNDDDDIGAEDIVEKNIEEFEVRTETEDTNQYITSLSEIPDSSMEKMKDWGVNVCFSDFMSGVSDNFNVISIDYIGSYFLTAREETNTDVQNRIILLYKVTVNLIGKDESGEVTSDLLEYYTYYEFHDAKIYNDEEFLMEFWDYSMCENAQACVIMDYSLPEQSNQAETVVYFGYSDLDEACNDIVSAYAGQYDYESSV